MRNASAATGTHVSIEHRSPQAAPARIEIVETAEPWLFEMQPSPAGRDQALSRADKAQAESDQTRADRDQRASDRDQAASDRDLSGGRVSAIDHARSRELRLGATHQRRQATRARLEAALLRREATRRREVAALERMLIEPRG